MVKNFAKIIKENRCGISLSRPPIIVVCAKMATTHVSSLVSHTTPIVNCSASASPPCSKLPVNNDHSSKPKQQQILKLTRRQAAIGIGFESLCVKFFDAVVLPQPASAAAECQFTVTNSGLAFCDKLVGYGAQPLKGQLIKAHYVGKLESGKVFDSSYNRGKPLTFRIGVGEVIKGWDQGILGGDGVPPMLAGGKRMLKLPPQLGYGMRGAGCKGGSCIIPPDSILLFDVEFIGKA